MKRKIDETPKWAVYCTEGHACIGPFETELEAVSVAIEMTRGGVLASTCTYDTIPFFGVGEQAPEGPAPSTGQYL